jgi:hypothetical protein
MDEYQRLNPNELIPTAVSADNSVVAVSTITRRSRQRLIPISGNSYNVSLNSGAGQMISFNLASSSQFVDPASAYIGFTCTVSTSGSSVLENGALSIFNRAMLKVAGVLAEDIVGANYKVDVDLITECPRDLYDSNVSALAGHWKYDNINGVGAITATSGYGIGSFSDVKTNLLDGVIPTINSAEGTGVRTYYIPLSHFFGLFSQERYIPLFCTGALEVDLQLNTVGNAMFDGTTAADALGYSLTNVNLYYDAVECIREVNQSYISAMQSSEGLIMPYQTTTTINRSYQGVNAAANSVSLVLNLATPFLRGIKLAQVSGTDSQGAGVPKHCYPRVGVNSVYYTLGSDNYPAYAKNLTAVDSLNNTIAGFSGFSKTDGTLLRYDAYMRDAVATGTANLVQTFVPCFNFCKNRGAVIDMDGVNMSAVGSTLAVYLDGTTAINWSSKSILVYAFLEYMRFLKLGNGAVSVMY